MRRVLIGLLVMMCLCTPAHALSVTGDLNGDKLVSESELVSDVLAYLNATYLGGEMQHLNITQLREAAHIHMYYPRTIVDSANRTVTIYRPADRIVTLFPTALRVVVQLDAADRIVGVCNRTIAYADNMVVVRAHPEIRKLPDVGMYNDPNAEKILSLKPDVIFAYAGVPDVADALQKSTDIPVVCLNPSPTGNEYSAQGGPFETWRLAGVVLEKEERAEELIAYCKEEFAKITAITSKIPDEDKPRVYFCHAHRATDITRAVTSYDPLDIAGGINVAGNLSGSGPSVVVDVSKEQIIAWNPDIILIHSFSKTPTLSIEGVLSDPDLQTVNAVKNKTVYYTKGWYIGWDPATGVAECFYMAKLFHPEKFSTLNVEKEDNAILKEFYGADGLYTWILDHVGNYHTWNTTSSSTTP